MFDYSEQRQYLTSLSSFKINSFEMCVVNRGD